MTEQQGVGVEPLYEDPLRSRLVRDFASAFIGIRGAHNPKPGEPCAWCLLAAEQAAEAVVTTGILATLDALRTPEPGLREAAMGLLIAVDNAALEALMDAEDGSAEPEWQTRLWDAADSARVVITPAALEEPTHE